MLDKRTIFIGDVHGCYDELLELVQKVDLRQEDHLYFVGDLINKGPKSREVVSWVRNRPNTWSVLGNHEFFSLASSEDISLRKLLSGETKEWLRAAVPKYQAIQAELLEWRSWLLGLPIYREADDWILLHAGIHPDFGIDTPLELMTTIRDLPDGSPWYEHYYGEKPIIYGHWAADGLRIRKNTIGLDTGCVFGGHLTAYCFETQEIWQVHAHDVYKIPADLKGKILKML